MIIKFIKVECTDCGYTAESAEVDEDWDELIEMEDGQCPRCKEKLIEEV